MDSSSPTDLSPDLVIFDAEHGDEGSHFYFLPPMVPNPGTTGVFDANQPAAVEVCEWTGSDCVLPAITDFSVGAGTVSVSVEDEHYLALWHAGDFALDLTKFYRISVFVGPQELGYADVQPVANGGGLKNIETGVTIGLVDNRTLPIKFRIEEGALGIAIDATALTATTFFLGGIGGFLSATPVVLDLAPGTYTVEDGSGGVHEFEITGTGLVGYAAEKEPFFDGLGTSQLTLVGYDVIIDAIALSSPIYIIGGIGVVTPGATVDTITFLPGVKEIQDGSGGVHEFEVTETGVVTYAVEKEPFFDGSGTSQLTLVGYSIDIDATALVAPTFALSGVASFSKTSVQAVVMLPGIKFFSSTDATFVFEIQDDGLLEYDTSLDVILSGRGTNILTVTP